jgi:hypothetical protein
MTQTALIQTAHKIHKRKFLNSCLRGLIAF